MWILRYLIRSILRSTVQCVTDTTSDVTGLFYKLVGVLSALCLLVVALTRSAGSLSAAMRRAQMISAMENKVFDLYISVILDFLFYNLTREFLHMRREFENPIISCLE